MLFDQAQGRFGIEAFHDDDGAAEALSNQRKRKRRAMKQWRWAEVNGVGIDVEGGAE